MLWYYNIKYCTLRKLDNWTKYFKGLSLCYFHIGGRRRVAATDADNSQKTPGLGFSKLD